MVAFDTVNKVMQYCYALQERCHPVTVFTSALKHKLTTHSEYTGSCLVDGPVAKMVPAINLTLFSLLWHCILTFMKGS